MANPVYFAGIDLESVKGFSVIQTDPYRPPVLVTSEFDLANADSSTISSARYKRRKVHVIGELGRLNRADFELGIRELEKLLRLKNQTLNFTQAGTSTDYYNTTRTNISITDQAGSWGVVDIEFTASNPFGYNTSSTSLYSYAQLVGPAYSFAINFDGNTMQQPVITITINSLLGGTTKTITVANPATSESLAVNRTWVALDVLIIDCKNKTVTVNGAVVDFTGSIPEWAPGLGAITYADTISNRNIAVGITYQKRWL